MTDFKIHNGDIAVDSAGRFIRLEDRDAQFQRALISVTARLGGFIYDRTLGSHMSEVETDKADAAQRLELVLNEALARFENTHVSVKELSDKLTLEIIIDGESRTEEVLLNGNI